MQNTRSLKLVGWLLVTAGCTEHGASPGGECAPDGRTPMPIAGEPCADPLPPDRASYLPPAACNAAETGTAIGTPSSAELMIDLMVGTWLICTPQSVFGTADEIGIEVSTDGRWYKLYPDGSGGTRRGGGFDGGGTWTTQWNGATAQLNLELTGGGMMITHPAFTDAPRRVRLHNSGLSSGDYVRNDSLGRCHSP